MYYNNKTEISVVLQLLELVMILTPSYSSLINSSQNKGKRKKRNSINNKIKKNRPVVKTLIRR